MGSWGPGVFENDQTMDFLGEVEEGGVTVLTATFRQLRDAPGRADWQTESTAVAAAAIVAAAYDDDTSLLPEEAVALVSALAPSIVADPTLHDRALRAVHGILTGDSELLELWRASGESDAAIDAIDQVRSRLQG